MTSINCDDFSAVLAIANGGTGITTITTNEPIIVNGSGAITTIATSATYGYPLTSNGAAVAPTWQSTLTGAALYLIQTTTVSSPTGTLFIPFPASSAYNNYMFTFSNITGSNAPTGAAYMFFNNASGNITSSYETGNLYTTTGVYGANVMGTTGGFLSNFIGTNPINGQMYLYMLPAQKPAYTGSVFTSAAPQTLVFCAGSNSGTTGSTITGVSLSYPGFNITGGSASLYGLLT